MGNIEVINIRRIKGEGNYYYIGRPSVLGNPFPIDKMKKNSRMNVISRYREWLQERLSEGGEVRDAFDYLIEKLEKGEDISLGCWCKPLACHGDVVKEMLMKEMGERNARRFKG